MTEIVKNNSALGQNLVSKFLDVVKKEKNNGVKNVYLRALRQLDRR